MVALMLSASRLSAQERLRGTQDALHRFGREETLVEEANWDPESGYEAAMRLLKRAPSTDAIFVQNDLMAIGVLHALYDLGLRAPDDCAVIGCDNLSTSAHTIPPLSSIQIPDVESANNQTRRMVDRHHCPALHGHRVGTEAISPISRR